MTCREKLMMEVPENVSASLQCGCIGCPSTYGYMDDPDYCNVGNMGETICTKCWDREIPDDNPSPQILDSGNRREFGTGAVRDIQEGKGRCDLMPLDVISMCYNSFISEDCKQSWIFYYMDEFTRTGEVKPLLKLFKDVDFFDDWATMFLEVAKHFEEGAKKYGESNWQKGIPTHCYIDSAVRHYLKHLRGDKDEPHDRAFVWNILCCIWTCKHKPELNDYAKENGK